MVRTEAPIEVLVAGRRAMLATVVALGGMGACQATPPSPPASRTAEIIGGSSDHGHEAVVYLEWDDHLCTGTLISSKIVLTAAHCMTEGGSVRAPNDVVFGSTSSATTVLHGAHAYVHPDHGSDAPFPNDVGVVVLGSRATVAAMPLGLDPAPGSGDVTLVGFGRRKADDMTSVGEKRSIVQAIDHLTAQAIFTGPALCGGDSGGPALLAVGGVEHVVGVISYSDQTCSLYGASQRVDVVGAWLTQMLAQQDPVSCEADRRCATGCATADPDCPCSADDGLCSALCEDPESDPDCPRGCGGGDVCVRGPSCPAPDPDCGDPCASEGHCLESCDVRDPDCPAPKPMGAACTRTFDCETEGFCYANICTPTCDPMHSTCGAGTTCTRVTAEVAVCQDDPASGGGCSCAVGGGRGAGRVAWIFLGLAGVVAVRSLRRKWLRAPSRASVVGQIT